MQGLDTPTPFLQLSGTIFKGEYDRLLGTELLFTESKGMSSRIAVSVSQTHTTSLDHVDCSRKQFCLVSTGLSEQRILFKEVEVRRKSPPPSDEDLASVSPPDENSVTQPRSAVAGPSTSKWNETLDQMTGKEVRKARAKGARKTSGKGKGKEKATEDDIDLSEPVGGFGGAGGEDDLMMAEDSTFPFDGGMAMDLG